MSPNENKEIVRELIAAWNRGDIQGIMAYWSNDMVHHGRAGAQAAADVGGEMSRFLQAFPDLRIEAHNLVAEGDLVCTRLTVRATNNGPYLGKPPTGREVECALMGQLRIVEGKVVEHWGVADALHLLWQLDLVPPNLLAATA